MRPSTWTDSSACIRRSAPLKPLFDQGRLAIVDAAGSPDPTRSHFDAQDYMESGTPGLKATDSGWMNRALAPEQGKVSPVRAVALGAVLPRSMRGGQPAIALESIAGFRVNNAAAAQQFEQMYESSNDPGLAATGRETFEAMAMLASHPAAALHAGRTERNIRGRASGRACGRSRN